MKQRGFSLIELLLTVLIGGIILTGLFSTLYQVSGAQAAIASITDVHQRAAILFNHLERDLMGAFIPEQVSLIKKDKKDKAESDEEEKKGIDKIFWGTVRDANLNTLTFITNNPLEVYLKATNRKPKPRVARVVYRLQPQKGVKNSFILTRQEGEDLSFALYTKTNVSTTQRSKIVSPAFEMIDGIASLGVAYLTPKQDNKKEDRTKKREYKSAKEWNSDQKKEQKTAGGKQKEVREYNLPEFIAVKLELWDIAYEKKYSFEYVVPIMFRKYKRDTPQPAAPKKPTQKPTASITGAIVTGKNNTSTPRLPSGIELTQEDIQALLKAGKAS